MLLRLDTSLVVRLADFAAGLTKRAMYAATPEGSAPLSLGVIFAAASIAAVSLAPSTASAAAACFISAPGAAAAPAASAAFAGRSTFFGCEAGNIGMDWTVTEPTPGLFRYALSFDGNPHPTGDMDLITIPLIRGATDVSNVVVPEGWTFDFTSGYLPWAFSVSGDAGNVAFESPAGFLTLKPDNPVAVEGEITFDSVFAPMIGPYRALAGGTYGFFRTEIFFIDGPVPNSIPEPGTLAMAAAGLISLAALRRGRSAN